MKLDFGQTRPDPDNHGYVVPTFGAEDRGPMAKELQTRLRKPMILGGIVIAVFVFGLGLWASLDKLATGITAVGEVRADTMRKTLRQREIGIVKQILVAEGQQVKAGQPLLLFNDVEARAAVDVLQNQYDTMITQNARFNAEATGAATINFPAEIMARIGQPAVAQLIRDQEFLFTTRRQVYESQTAVLGQRVEQQLTQVSGQQAQLDSIIEQQRLTQEELDGYRKLNEQGFAPKTLVLRYERSMAELAGRKGQLQADIARIRQQMGETRLQLTQLRNER
ncbi:MAG: biotin/lipoyl-binding protein, partial [Alphaproteobacteria bacterium]